MNKVAVFLDDDRIVIKSPFKLKDKIKKIPGATWDPTRKAWTVAATVFGAKAVDVNLAMMSIAFDLDAGVEALATADLITANSIREVQDTLPGPSNVRTVPMKHQVRGFNMIKTLDACCLAWDMGTGKTKAVVDYVGTVLPELVLIACPSAIVRVWPKEFRKHTRSDISVTALRDGSTKKRASLMKNTIARIDGGRPAVFVVNYEALSRKELQEAVIGIPWDLVVLDESHRIKAPGGKISTFFKRLGKKVPKRVILSGTPMPHSPLDIYAQYRFLDPSIFGTSFTAFKAQFAVEQDCRDFKKVVAFKNLDELNERFYMIADRVTTEEVLPDLPELLPPVIREGELSKEESRVYRELEEEFIADVQSGIVTASNALTRLLRLAQITSGFTMTEDERRVDLGDSKIKLLSDLLEDIPEDDPVVVVCRFRRDVEQVASFLAGKDRETFKLYGGTDEFDEWKECNAANKSLVFQIQSGKEGLDMTETRFMIYYSIGFSLGDYRQSVKRSHRKGQTRAVTPIYLMMRSNTRATVDHKIINSIEQKGNLIESILTMFQDGDNDD